MEGGEESKDVAEDGEGSKSEESEDKEEKSEKSEDSDSEEDKKDADTPDNSEDESEDDSGDDKNTKKTSPDAKGGNKKRLESNKAIKAGETDGEVCSHKVQSQDQVLITNRPLPPSLLGARTHKVESRRV